LAANIKSAIYGQKCELCKQQTARIYMLYRDVGCMAGQVVADWGDQTKSSRNLFCNFMLLREGKLEQFFFICILEKMTDRGPHFDPDVVKMLLMIPLFRRHKHATNQPHASKYLSLSLSLSLSSLSLSLSAYGEYS
jgi:hypothetical protein